MAYGLPQPGAGLAGMRSANLTGPAPQGAASAPSVQTQARPNPSPVAQAVPPQMQELQAQLANAAQMQASTAPNIMQQIMSMIGPGAGARMGAPTLGSLMQPMGQPQMPQAAQMLGAPAVGGTPSLTPVQAAATGR